MRVLHLLLDSGGLVSERRPACKNIALAIFRGSHYGPPTNPEKRVKYRNYVCA